jgi:two-component system, OmpR family, phosphate regulon response regulator PhoB
MENSGIMEREMGANPRQNASARPLIALGEPNEDVRSLLEYVLTQNGFDVVSAGDGQALIERLEDLRPHVVLLDSLLPGGATTAANLRLKQTTREAVIIILTPASEEGDHLALLSSGADAWLTKPVSPETLIVRMRAAMARSGRSEQAGDTIHLSFTDLEMDVVTYRVWRNGSVLRLTPTEFRLLRHLMRNPGRVHSRGELASAAWQNGIYVSQRTVDVHMGRLRKALKSKSGKDLIRTVRSFGYALHEPDDEG